MLELYCILIVNLFYRDGVILIRSAILSLVDLWLDCLSFLIILLFVWKIKKQHIIYRLYVEVKYRSMASIVVKWSGWRVFILAWGLIILRLCHCIVTVSLPYILLKIRYFMENYAHRSWLSLCSQVHLVLPFKGLDIVPKVQWLQSLGMMSHDLGKVTLAFEWKGTKVQLKGEPTSKPHLVSFSQLWAILWASTIA